MERTGINAIQLHGNEPPVDTEGYRVPVIKRIEVRPEDTSISIAVKMEVYQAAAFLLDPDKGSGNVFDWNIARPLRPRIVIAGGLTAKNVSSAVKTARPYAVDVCSGVEAIKGVKDSREMTRFINEVRKCSMP